MELMTKKWTKLKKLFNDNEWQLKTTKIMNVVEPVPAAGQSTLPALSETVASYAETECLDPLPVPSGSQAAQVEGECGFCHCAPCVTTYRQSWLGKGQAPSTRNSGIRKKLYKNYWGCLDRRKPGATPRTCGERTCYCYRKTLTGLLSKERLCLAALHT